MQEKQGRQDGLVSIIVPVYEAYAYLEDTVRSVQAQTAPEWELILVDDCSKDESYALMEKLALRDGRIRCFRQPQNAGAAKARNRGLMEARGRYLAYLDADDIWKPRKLEKELAYMKEKKAGFVFTGYEFADEQARGLGKVVKVPPSLNYRQALQNTTIFTSTVLFDRERIDEKLLQMPCIASEDTAAWWQILRNGHTAYGLNENLVLYRRSAGTLSSNKWVAVRRIWRLYREAEQLSVPYSMYNFVFYAVRAVLRRL